MKEKPEAEKKKSDNFKQDERGQTQPATREQAQGEAPRSPGQPAGGE